MAKDAYYFPHDLNAKDDEKCLFIISKFGLAGYGLYWMFIEKMHQQSDGKLTCDLLEGLALCFNTDITLLQEFYNTAITIKLFVTDGEKYWSERVLRNKKELEDKRNNRSLAGRLGMEKRWKNEAKNNSVITENNSVITEHNKVKESKVNKIKEKDIYGELQNVFLSPSEYQKLKTAYGESNTLKYIENLSLYIAQKGKDPYKSHYATLRNWLNRDGITNKPEDYDPW
jgi:hypothetical protein